jgi:hypothetical protein
MRYRLFLVAMPLAVLACNQAQDDSSYEVQNDPAYANDLALDAQSPWDDGLGDFNAADSMSNAQDALSNAHEPANGSPSSYSTSRPDTIRPPRDR